MPLSIGFADVVRFDCEGCRTSHDLRQMRKSRGGCRKCGGLTHTLHTEFYEGNLSTRGGINGLVTKIMLQGFGVAPTARNGEVHRFATTNVPGNVAFNISDQGAYKAKLAAFQYMELRKRVDAEREREQLRETKGACNCVVCEAFFVPSAEKPWTKAKCCSKVCYAKVAAQGDSLATASVPPATTKAARMVLVTCSCGNQFPVPAIFIGAARACPKCGAKTTVSE